MGPADSCEYADIAMSAIDNIVMSDKNPCKQPLIWARFRDDIWDPWVWGEDELKKFTNWLNTLYPTIKFELVYKIGEGIEFLDTYIFSENGVIKTRIYSKESDTHAYLHPDSCHPSHIFKNIPKSTSKRLHKICTNESDYEHHSDIFAQHLEGRGYSKPYVKNVFKETKETGPRQDLYQTNSKLSPKKRVFPLVVEFNPHLPNVAQSINRHKNILRLDKDLVKIINPDKIFASFTQPRSLGGHLIRSTFSSSDVEGSETELPSSSKSGSGPAIGCKRCKNYITCKTVIREGNTFKSNHCPKIFHIQNEISCTTEGVIYLMNDLTCKRSYIGSTSTNFRKRWSNYKSHIKIGHIDCEIALHFNDCDKHVIDYNRAGKGKIDNVYESCLKSQLEVILIDTVDLSTCKDRVEKRRKLEEKEGKWQTELRTLQRYGGLNKKDDRKISNKKATAINLQAFK